MTGILFCRRQRARWAPVVGVDLLGKHARHQAGTVGLVPFADENMVVAVVRHRPEWSADFVVLAAQIRDALGGQATAIDHVGSTSVPGLAAKDCIDVQVRVESIDEQRLTAQFGRIGFRCRPESWNRAEITNGQDFPKLVFAQLRPAEWCTTDLQLRAGLT